MHDQSSVYPVARFSGEIVTVSGMYIVEHGGSHKPLMKRFFPMGLTVPKCPSCGRVRITLQHAAPYISEDEDFCPPSR